MIGTFISSESGLSSGGTITGHLTIDGDLTVTGSGAGYAYTEVLTGDMVIQDTTDNATGGVLRLQNTRGGGAGSDGDDAGTISFYASDAGSNSEEMSTILSEVALNTTGSTAGKLTFKTMQGNSSTALLTLSGWAGGSHASTVSSSVFNTGIVGIENSAPETWTDDYSVLQVGGAGSLSATTTQAAGDAVFLSHNSYFDKTNTRWEYMSTNADDEASQMYLQNGTVVFRTTGTAGADDAVVTWVKSMVLDANSRISLSNNDGNTENTVFGYNALTNAGTVLEDVGADFNVAVGHKAMGTGNTTSAEQNVAVGNLALEDIISGNHNIAIGSNAGGGITTLNDTVFIGGNAGVAVTVTGGSNAYDGTVGIGKSALTALTTGAGNTAVGYEALKTEDTGSYSTAIGHSALKIQDNANGQNTAVGYNSQISTGSGQLNVSVGNLSMRYIGGSSANNNVAIGNLSMQSSGTITDNVAANNTAVGADTLKAITTGLQNVAIGSSAGTGITTASKCVLLGSYAGDALTVSGAGSDGTVAVGYEALSGLTGGHHNMAIGYQAGLTLSSEHYNVFIGYQAGKLSNGSYNTVLGHMAFDAVTSGASDNVAIGNNAMGGAIGAEVVDDCVAVGAEALAGALDSTNGVDEASGTVAIGKSALAALTSGAKNTAVGYQALTAETIGDFNTAVGYRALATQNGVDGPVGSTAVGYLAGEDITLGEGNTLMGNEAGKQITIGMWNTAIGLGSLLTSVDGDGNTAIGYQSLYTLEVGDGTGFNTALGYRSAYLLSTGVGNIAIGASAMLQHTTGSRNIAIGFGAMDGTAGDADDAPASTDNIFIGYDAGGGNWEDDEDSNYNVGVGNSVMDAAMDGALRNTGVGQSALGALTTGVDNVAVGRAAGDSITTGATSTIIGEESDGAATAGNQIAIGYGAVASGSNVGIWGNASVATNNITVDWTVTSDERIKKDIEDSDIGLSFINALKPRKFRKKHPSEWDAEILEERYKNGGGNYDDEKDEVIKDEFDDKKVLNGLIAQEVKESMDELDVEFSGWSEAPNSKQSIQYSTLVMPLIKAVQELSAQVEELKEQLENK